MITKWIWRVMIALLAAGALGIILFGPRPNMAAPPDRVRIQYWEKWTGVEGQQMQAVVDRFNDTIGKEKHIWVDFVSMSKIDQKTLISTAAGVPPDVAGLWDTQVLQFASMNALEPLDKYVKEAGWTRDHFKHVFYDGCTYQGTLYALPSTVYSVALIWNKVVFQQKAAELRAAGLDPDRATRTIDELDRYAKIIDTWETRNGIKHLTVAGLSPLDPGSFTNYYSYWFGGHVVDDSGTRIELTSQPMVDTYNWIRGYSERLGKGSIAEFRSGLGNFDSPQNPFIIGELSMEQQGPWVAAFIEKLAPSMNRWHVPPDQLQRERDFDRISVGMSLDEVQGILGRGDNDLGHMDSAPSQGKTLHWLAGIKDIFVTFQDGKVSLATWRYLPAEERQKYCQWGAAPFPTAVPGLENVTLAGMDVLVIPSTSKHKNEAFEFIKFALQQDQIEHLTSQHCNLSPLADESKDFLRDHPNAYANVWDSLSSSPNARPLPPLPDWPYVFDELTQVAERSALMEGSTMDILSEIQLQCQKDLNNVLNLAEDWNLGNSASPLIPSLGTPEEGEGGGTTRPSQTTAALGR